MNVHHLDEMRGLVWRRDEEKVTLYRRDLWECKEQTEYLNFTLKIRSVELNITLRMTELELIIKLQTSKKICINV